MVSEPVGTWTRRVRWDEAGRLLAAWGEGAGAPAGTWAFAYDHNGERVLKYRIEGGQVAGATLYLRDEQGNVLSEMQWVDTGAAGYWARAKDHVYLGRDLIGSFDRSTGEPHVVSYARDHLGSQRAEVWGLDTSTATDLWPYGALARTKAAGGPPALANGPHLFTGHEREYTGSEALADPLMGLDYMHARYYSNTLGRFLSVDPGDDTSLGFSQSWNCYSYTRNNPIRFIDDDGEGILDFLYGLSQGVLGSVSYGQMPHTDPTPNDTRDQRRGQIVGATLVQLGGADLFFSGAGTTTTAVVAEVASGGAATPVAVPGAAVGVGEMAVGGALVVGSGVYLAKAADSSGGPTGRPKSPNQMNQEIKKGKAPSGIKRVDRAKVKGEMDHVHFHNGAALNKDGTWKHGKAPITKKQRIWLESNGWKVPK